MAKQSATTELIIDKWQTGIADSPHLGFGEMRNVDISGHPGALRLSPVLSNVLAPAISGTFTVNTATDILTGPNLGWSIGPITVPSHTGRAVTLTTTGTLPAPLLTNTIYFLIATSNTTYKLATTLTAALSGTGIDITTTGTGTHTITSVNPGLMKFFANDNSPNGFLYAIDSNGQVWRRGTGTTEQWYLVTGNSLNNASGNGLAIWKSFLFAFRNNAVDVYEISTTTWTNNWQNMNMNTGTPTVSHFALVSIDDNLYIADADPNGVIPYVVKLSENANTTFDPSNSATYNYNLKAITLAKYKNINCMVDLGVNLALGTSGREIYLYNRTSLTLNIPLILPEKNITAMIVNNNLLYIGAGQRGNLYYSDSSSVSPYKIFPRSLLVNDYAPAIIGAMATLGRKLLFTVQSVSCSGVYSIDFATKGLVLENIVSSGSLGAINAISIPALYSDGISYFVSSYDQTTYLLDESMTNNAYYYPTGYTGYAVSPFYEVGEALNQTTKPQLEIYLTSPLATGEGVRVSWRKDLGSSFTTVATFDFTTYGSQQVFNFSSSFITNAAFFQVKVALTSSAIATTPPELKKLMFKPND